MFLTCSVPHPPPPPPLPTITTHRHVHAHMRARTHTHTHARMHARTHTHTYGHSCTHTHTYLYLHTHSTAVAHMTHTHMHTICRDIDVFIITGIPLLCIYHGVEPKQNVENDCVPVLLLPKLHRVLTNVNTYVNYTLVRFLWVFFHANIYI